MLRTNLCYEDPAKLWQFYIQLVESRLESARLPCRVSSVPILSMCLSNAYERTIICRLIMISQVTSSRLSRKAIRCSLNFSMMLSDCKVMPATPGAARRPRTNPNDESVHRISDITGD